MKAVTPRTVLSWICTAIVLARIDSAHAGSPIPFVPTRHDTVRDLLWLADAGTNDVVYDLGSGDGRVVIAAVRDFGARKAVGIEIDSKLIEQSRQNAIAAGVSDRVRFIQGDLFTNDFSEASVVVLYLGHGPNLDLRARLAGRLKPGARIVSHQFGMGEWPADKLLDVRTAVLGMYGEMWNEFRSNPAVPDFDPIGSRATHDACSLWIVPAPVAGSWRGKLAMDSGPAEIAMTLHQRLSGVSGEFQIRGATNIAGTLQADLWGGHVRLHCVPTNRPYGQFLMWFEGQANGDVLEGKWWITQLEQTNELRWTGHRDKADFTGAWQWSGPARTPVQLNIERRDGQWAVTYLDKTRTNYLGKLESIPIVRDFYDFGGGFYFTLLLGLGPDGSRRVGPQDGWLIGEAVMEGDALRGRIAFYHCRDRSGEASATSAEPDIPHEWRAVRAPRE